MTVHIQKLGISCFLGKVFRDCFVTERDYRIHQTFGPHHVEIRDDGEENGGHGVFYSDDE